jgi:pimeloyl-ACP methyl ester carboxylesterase
MPRLDHPSLALLTLWLLPTLAGCGLFWRAPVPMRAIDYPSPQGQAKCLVVFLPGMGDEAEAFAQHGMVEEIRRRSLAVDVVAANATIGYYSHGVFADRLATDVIAPRRARGYQQTWLIGPSMGGFGTLFYARQRLGDVTGVLALAPFLGDRGLIDEVRQAGGLDRWKGPPRVDQMNSHNYQRELLRWLQAATRGQEPAPILNIGFGNTDKLARADQLLAAVLPPDHVFHTDGGHNWGPWRALLAQFLDRGDLAKSCRYSQYPMGVHASGQ